MRMQWIGSEGQTDAVFEILRARQKELVEKDAIIKTLLDSLKKERAMRTKLVQIQVRHCKEPVSSSPL